MPQRKSKELSAEQLKSAVRKAIENAGMLINEAEILFSHGCWARVVFLAQIAGEEIGKAKLLLSARALLLEEQLNWTDFWQKYKDHKSKLGTVAFFEEVGQMARSSRPIEKHLKEFRDRIARQDLAKMASLYSDFSDGIAISPSEIATEEWAAACLSSAQERLKIIQEPLTRALFSPEFDFHDDRDRDQARSGVVEQLRKRYRSDFHPAEPD